MAPLTVGNSFPKGVQFEHAPVTDSDLAACGRVQTYNADEEFAGKRVVLVSVPGAFTPSCHANHIPAFIKQIPALKEKSVDLIAVIASNDAWVMNAWAKAQGASGKPIVFLSDTKTFFSKAYGWAAGMGDRNGRWAMVIEKDGKISYAQNESDPTQVTVSGAEAVLEKL